MTESIVVVVALPVEARDRAEALCEELREQLAAEGLEARVGIELVYTAEGGK